MAPFRGLFEPLAISDQSVLDTSLLFAMVIYGLVALLLQAAIDWLSDRIGQRHQRLHEQARAAYSDQRSTTDPGV